MIHKAMPKDALIIAGLAIQMWPDNTVEELAKEFEKLTVSEECAIFICLIENQAIGFAQCQLRHDYVEGTESSPVGYLEGIFVKANYRKNGCARELLLAYEIWAKDMGCTEFASDCELDNIGSLKFHIAMGFDEANRIICFKKNI